MFLKNLKATNKKNKEANNTIFKVINKNIIEKIRKKKFKLYFIIFQNINFYKIKILKLICIMQNIKKQVQNIKKKKYKTQKLFKPKKLEKNIIM